MSPGLTPPPTACQPQPKVIFARWAEGFNLFAARSREGPAARMRRGQTRPRPHTHPLGDEVGREGEASTTEERLCLGQQETPERGWCDRGWARGQIEAFEDGADGIGRLDRGQNAHRLAASGAAQRVDGEHAGQQVGPRDSSKAGQSRSGLTVSRSDGIKAILFCGIRAPRARSRQTGGLFTPYARSGHHREDRGGWREGARTRS